MGSESNGGKFRYDLSMSKRTRKPLNREKEDNQCALKSSFSDKEIPQKGENDEKEDEHCFKVVDEGEESDHKSLKQLIEGRSTLGQHFTTEEMKQPMLVHKHDEKKLQLVVTHHEEGLDGVRFKEMVSRCAKVLSRLIKKKRDPRIGSRRISTLR